MSWMDEAACGPGRPVNPEWWWPPVGVDVDADRAQHICRTHCPVLDSCDREAQVDPPRWSVVVGGRRYVSGGGGGGMCQPTIRTPRSVTDCPYCLLEET